MGRPHFRLQATCRRCGEVLKATNGEGLLSKRTSHAKSCHPGFDVEKIDEYGKSIGQRLAEEAR